MNLYSKYGTVAFTNFCEVDSENFTGKLNTS